jgi:Tfp pilus assembly protein PilZ
LRWTPGLATLFSQVAQVISDRETVFVPTLESALAEGDQLYLEVVPPLSHAVFRMLAEVVWVERGGVQADLDGVGLRLGGLSAMDRHLLDAIQGFYKAEGERYR